MKFVLPEIAAGWIVVVPPEELARPMVPVVVPGLPITGVAVALHAADPRLRIVPCADGAPKLRSKRGLRPVAVGWASDEPGLPHVCPAVNCPEHVAHAAIGHAKAMAAATARVLRRVSIGTSPMS